MKMKTLAVGCLMLGMMSSSFAKDDLFGANINIDGQSIPYKSYDKILDLADQYTTANLKQLAPQYSAQSAVQAQISYLGLDDISITFAANSTRLNLEIPSANISRVFEEETRNASRKAMVEFLKKMPSSLTEALVESSYHHPVNEARVKSIDNLYDSTILVTDNFSTSENPAINGSLSQSDSMVVFAPRFGQYTQGDLKTDVITLPLTYAKWLANQRFTLVVDAPVTVSRTEEAISGQGSIGVGINSAINDNWSLMPHVRLGAVISPDFGTSALLFTSSLTSNYRFNLSESAKLNMINIMSYYQTESLEIKSYKSDYNLSNFVFRNGLEYTQRLNTTMWGKPIILKLHGARTDYTGDAVYSKYSHDVGGSIGIANPTKIKFMKEFRVGVNYNETEHDIRGFTVNAGYSF